MIAWQKPILTSSREVLVSSPASILDFQRGVLGLSEAEAYALAVNPATPSERLLRLSYRMNGLPVPPSADAAVRNPGYPNDALAAGLYTGTLAAWRNPSVGLVLLVRPDLLLRATLWGLYRIIDREGPADLWVEHRLSLVESPLLGSVVPYDVNEDVSNTMGLAKTLCDNEEKAEAFVAIKRAWTAVPRG